MVDIQDAVKIASDCLLKVMPEYKALSPAVEEFELSKDGSVWNITFRAKNPDASNGTQNVFYPYLEKVVQIRADNGTLIAIRVPSYA
jgi:hypothetical protein